MKGLPTEVGGGRDGRECVSICTIEVGEGSADPKYWISAVYAVPARTEHCNVNITEYYTIAVRYFTLFISPYTVIGHQVQITFTLLVKP